MGFKKGNRFGKTPLGNQNSLTHGVNRYRNILEGSCDDSVEIGLHDALYAKEQEFIGALGGDPSPQQMVLIRDTAKNLFYVGLIDSYLSGLVSVVYKGRVKPVLIERTRLAAHVRDNLRVLGLNRVARPISLEEVLNGHDDNEQETNETPAS